MDRGAPLSGRISELVLSKIEEALHLQELNRAVTLGLRHTVLKQPGLVNIFSLAVNIPLLDKDQATPLRRCNGTASFSGSSGVVLGLLG